MRNVNGAVDIVNNRPAGLWWTCDSRHTVGVAFAQGGNVEEADGDLLETAKREATEEMGRLPPFRLHSRINTTCAFWR